MPRKLGDKNLSPSQQTDRAKIRELKEKLKEAGERLKEAKKR